ncbi:MAG: hypothetical protein Kow0074_15950 [Candidatus Zixiibacteriota bacterium]
MAGSRFCICGWPPLNQSCTNFNDKVKPCLGHDTHEVSRKSIAESDHKHRAVARPRVTAISNSDSISPVDGEDRHLGWSLPLYLLRHFCNRVSGKKLAQANQ